MQAGAGAALSRLREPGTLVALALSMAFTTGVALLERIHGHSGAADRALAGGAFGIALPLFCYFVVARICANSSVQAAAFPLARHGLSRSGVMLGLLVPSAALTMVFAAASGAWVVALTRGASDPALFRDSIASVWIGAVAALGYTAALLGASAFGRRGRGRGWLLAADFLLGAGSSLFAAPWPKGHVRNLLGGVPVLELSQPTALGMLVGTSLAFLWLGSLRVAR